MAERNNKCIVGLTAWEKTQIMTIEYHIAFEFSSLYAYGLRYNAAL
jgi:hypothetical protein